MLTKLATKMLGVFSIVAMMIAPPAAAQSLSASDMEFAFGGSAKTIPASVVAPRNLESARAMTKGEMEETEGAWLFHAVRHGGGAVLGGYGAGYGYLAGGGRSARGFLGSVATGALGGAFSPVSGARSAGLTFGGSFGASALGSFGSRRGWW